MHVVGSGTLTDYAGNLEPFINQIPDYALFMLDPSGRVVSWNVGAERLKGYTTQEIVGRNFSVFYTAEDVAMDKPRRALDIAAQEGTYQEEGLRVRKDGAAFWATVTITAVKDPEGKLRGFAKLTRDITERKMHEAALHAAEKAKYQALFENNRDAIFLTRPKDGAVLAVNPAACSLFDYSEQQLLSMNRDALLDVSDPRFTQAWVERAGTGAVEAELTFIRRDGARFEARVSSKLFTDESGCQVACTSIHDITQRKQAEEALRQSEERFRLLYENAPLGIIRIDQKGYLTAANRKFAEISGYSPEEAVGLTYRDVTLPEETDRIAKIAEDLLFGPIDTIQYERRLLRKDGSTRWVLLTGRLIRGAQGEPPWGMVLFEDIAERKQAEEALRQSEEHFRATFEHMPLGISECTLEGRFINANPKDLDIHGYTKDELVHLTIMDVTHPGDMEETLSNLQKLAAGEIDSYVMEKRLIRKDRSIVWVNVTNSLIAIHGKPKYIVSAVEDITERKKAEAKLKRAMEMSYHQANHDMLTGLANRASFNDRLKEALAYARRDEHLVAIHMLDLDRFKSINDTLGHHIGDLLLQEVAKRIKSQMRATDFAARVGGDEFVVIQTHLAAPAGAKVLAGKLVEELGHTYVLEGQEVHSNPSIGIAIYPNDAEDPAELVRHADLAMYEAKHHGRFNYQFYHERGAAFREGSD